MKKIISLLCAVTLFSLLRPVSAVSCQNWYFSSRGQNERPSLPTVDPSLAKGIGLDEKVLYLTFDAGYENGNVAKIADILKEEEVPAAFFILKHFAKEQKELCIKLKEDGHLICNHTASHPNITTVSSEALTAELKEMEKVFEEETGYKLDPYFRPPEGAYNEEALQTVSRAGYRTVFWSLAWADWDNQNQKSPEYATDKLCSRVHNGAVILLHPTSDTNAKILRDLIRRWKAEGYRFGTLQELWDA